MRVLHICLFIVVTACNSTHKVPLNMQPPPPSTPLVQATVVLVGLDAPPVATPVELTARETDQYPSMAHLRATLPSALRAQGVDVLKDPREPAFRLELLAPEVDAFRRADGTLTNLVGGVQDVHVTHRALVKSWSGELVGVAVGRGEAITRAWWHEPSVRTLAIAAPTAVLTALVGGVWLLSNLPVLLGQARPNILGRSLPFPTVDIGGADVDDVLLGMAINLGALMAGALVVQVLVTVGVMLVVGFVLDMVAGTKDGTQWNEAVQHAHDQSVAELARQVAHICTHVPTAWGTP